MSTDLFLALLGFAFVTSITPGPNNLMLMASGANFGFRRTLPHLLGVAGGFGLMAFLMGAGLVGIFERWPGLRDAMKIAALVYMLWLAWKIAHAGAPGQGREDARPLTLWQAAGFQWVNPKALAMALTAVTAYAPDRSLAAVALVALAFSAVNLPSISLWVVAGQQIRHLLTRPGRLAAFNWTMAALLLAALIPVLRA